MNIWFQIAIIVVSLYVSRMNRPKINSRPDAFTQADFPQVEEGTPQAVVFGDTWTTSWTVLGLKTDAAEVPPRRIKIQGETTGWWYGMDIHMGLCIGEINKILKIKVGDKFVYEENGLSVAYANSIRPNRSQMNSGGTLPQPDGDGSFWFWRTSLFGGEKGQGGVYTLDGTDAFLIQDNLLPLTSQQTMLLERLHGSPAPKFKGMVSVFFEGYVAAFSPFAQPWKFRILRVTKGWDGGVWYASKAGINLASNTIHAMNPAHILYECLTNRDWGRGVASARLDIASFVSAADTLFTEGFGLCLLWSRQTTLSDFIQSILDHIGATQGVKRSTGLITLRLIRDDYDVEDLPSFDSNTGLLGIDEDSIGSQSTATNELIVKYIDPISNESKIVTAKNLASIQSIGVASETIEYPGIPTPDLAARVAQRDLRAKSGQIKRFKVRLDRRAYAIEPGDAFVISAPEIGIQQIVLRAARIEDGTYDQSAIVITTVQDIFGLPATSYLQTESSSWLPPNTAPSPIVERKILEIPYQQLTQFYDPANFLLIADTACFVGSLALKPTALSVNYQLQTRVGAAPFVNRFDSDFTFSTTLLADINRIDTILSIAGFDFISSGIEEGDSALIDGEIVRITYIAPGTFVSVIHIARGCVDTVPENHLSGSRIWFFVEGLAVDPTVYSNATNVNVRLVPETTADVLDPTLAAVDSIIMNRRFARPYPPGRFRIDGAIYPDSAMTGIVLTWAHRDRISQYDDVIDTNNISIGPEAGTTYTARLLNADDLTVLSSTTGITGTTTTLSASFYGDIIIELWSVRAGLASWQKHSHTLTYFGTAPRGVESGEVYLTVADEYRVLES